MSRKILPLLLIMSLVFIGVSFVWMQNMDQNCPFLKLMKNDCAKTIGALAFLEHHISGMTYITNYILQKLYSPSLLALMIFITVVAAVYFLRDFFVGIYLVKIKEKLSIYKTRFLHWLALFKSLNPKNNLTAHGLQ